MTEPVECQTAVLSQGFCLLPIRRVWTEFYAKLSSSPQWLEKLSAFITIEKYPLKNPVGFSWTAIILSFSP